MEGYSRGLGSPRTLRVEEVLFEWITQNLAEEFVEYVLLGLGTWLLWRFLPLRRALRDWFTAAAWRLDEEAMRCVCVGDVTCAYDCWELAELCLSFAGRHGYLDWPSSAGVWRSDFDFSVGPPIQCLWWQMSYDASPQGSVERYLAGERSPVRIIQEKISKDASSAKPSYWTG